MEEKIIVRPCTRGGERRKSSDFSDLLSPEDELSYISGLSVTTFSSLLKLEIKINSEEVALHKFGSLCPSVVELKLSNSFIPSIRELGTDWSNLEILWVVKSCLNDIDGISALPKLQELYCSFNSVSSLSSLMFHDSVQILDLEANKILDLSEIDSLQYCPSLALLTLKGNPVSYLKEYRAKVLALLGSLKTLDDSSRDVQEVVFENREEVEIVINAIREASVRQKSKRPGSAADESSALTEEVFTGNPLKAMRFRRKKLFESTRDNFMNLVREFKIEEVVVPRKKSARPRVVKENNIMIKSVGKSGFYETR